MHTWETLQRIQPLVVKMLHNSVKKNRVAHAYLFVGDRGTSKKDAAFLFAQTLFCHNKVNEAPCMECKNCKRIASRNHPDVHFLEPDGQSLKKEQIIDLQKEFAKTGMESNQKIYIIAHADKMTDFAANSLLKFLEEPHAKATAILLTEQFHQILPTIVSRCQIITFQPLTPELLTEKLTEKGIQKHIAKTVSHLTNNLEEALAIVEDDWFAQARNIVIQLIETIYERRDQSLFFIQDQIVNHCKDKEMQHRCLELLLLWYKDLIYTKVGEEDKVIFIDQLDRLQKITLRLSNQQILTQIGAILEAKKRLDANVNFHLLMDQLALKLQEG